MKILDCSFWVHSDLGPGLPETACFECLDYELFQEGLKTGKQKPLLLVIKEIWLDAGYRIDILAERSTGTVIKYVDEIWDVFIARTITYMKLSVCKPGLLINFNVKHLKDGIKRLIL